MFTNYPDVVNVDQMCEMLNICKTQAYIMLREGLIKSKRIGRIYKIPKIYIVQYLDSDYN
ncbi:MAG TPA: helix-turn-helix domain-containing protein [Bacillota bacterium]|nr:helix-turn-helix domain-containing protein [Bacillota bacterium]